MTSLSCTVVSLTGANCVLCVPVNPDCVPNLIKQFNGSAILDTKTVTASLVLVSIHSFFKTKVMEHVISGLGKHTELLNSPVPALLVP